MTMPEVPELIALTGPAYKQQFYCNKCGYIGETGPVHQKDGSTYPDQCGYDATGGSHYYTADQMREYGQQCANAASLRGAVPDGLIARIESAERRIQNNHAPRRIPAHPTDVDLVLAEVRMYLQGEPQPFWIVSPTPTDKDNTP